MKSRPTSIISYPSIIVFLLLAACNPGTEKIEYLTNENTELRENYQQQLIETRTVTKSADSLQTIVHSLESEIQKMKGDMPVYNASTEDEKAIEALVANLHQGWTNMMKNQDTNELLQYFLPKYTTGSLRINTENIPSVQRGNNANFEDYLNEVLLLSDMTISFGQTKFLYTEVRDDVFVTTYRFKLRAYQNNEQIQTNSLVTQLAGQKKDGAWKVGSYNWVSFNY